MLIISLQASLVSETSTGFPPSLFDCPEDEEADQLTRSSIQWALRHQLLLGQAEAWRAEAYKTGSLITAIYRLVKGSSNVAQQRIIFQAASDLVLWVCVADDILERTAADEIEKFREYLSVQLDLVPVSSKQPQKEYKNFPRRLYDVAAAALSITDRISRACNDPRYLRLFAQFFDRFVACCLLEAQMSSPAQSRFTLESYMNLRSETICVRPFLVLGAILTGASMPPRLESVTCAIVGLQNDLCTFWKDVADPRSPNLLKFVIAASRCEVDEAKRWSMMYYRLLMQEFRSLVSQAQRDPECVPFVDLVIGWVTGHLAWARHTGRYQPKGAKL